MYGRGFNDLPVIFNNLIDTAVETFAFISNLCWGTFDTFCLIFGWKSIPSTLDTFLIYNDCSIWTRDARTIVSFLAGTAFSAGETSIITFDTNGSNWTVFTSICTMIGNSVVCASYALSFTFLKLNFIEPLGGTREELTLSACMTSSRPQLKQRP